jgi:hypothetical protein
LTGAAAGDHLHTRQRCQLAPNVIGYSSGEILILGLVQVDERQHGYAPGTGVATLRAAPGEQHAKAEQETHTQHSQERSADPFGARGRRCAGSRVAIGRRRRAQRSAELRGSLEPVGGYGREGPEDRLLDALWDCGAQQS